MISFWAAPSCITEGPAEVHTQRFAPAIEQHSQDRCCRKIRWTSISCACQVTFSLTSRSPPMQQPRLCLAVVVCPPIFLPCRRSTACSRLLKVQGRQAGRIQHCSASHTLGKHICRLANSTGTIHSFMAFEGCLHWPGIYARTVVMPSVSHRAEVSA